MYVHMTSPGRVSRIPMSNAGRPSSGWGALTEVFNDEVAGAGIECTPWSRLRDVAGP